MKGRHPELGGPSGQSGAPLQIQSIPIRRQRPVPTFFAITNCHHGDHHKKDSSQMQSFLSPLQLNFRLWGGGAGFS